MSETSEIIQAEVIEDAAALPRLAGSSAALASDKPKAGLSAGQRRQRKVWLGVLVAVYGISLAVPRSNLPHVPLCWLNAWIGFPCPTCGLTRAFTEIGHGQFAAATQLNLMAIPIFLVGLVIAGTLIYELRTGRSIFNPWVYRHRLILIMLVLISVVIRYLPMI